MEIRFADRRLAKACSTERELDRRFGAEAGKRLRGRLAQLEAASCLEDLRNAPGRCHELTADRRGQLSLDVHGPYRVIFEPTDRASALDQHGGLDWSAVERVVIIEIADTHR